MHCWRELYSFFTSFHLGRISHFGGISEAGLTWHAFIFLDMIMNIDDETTLMDDRWSFCFALLRILWTKYVVMRLGVGNILLFGFGMLMTVMKTKMNGFDCVLYYVR